MISILVCCVIGMSVLLAMGGIWLKFHPKFLKPLFHDTFGWHEPDDSVSFDGCSQCSRCKFCGKEILQDSQGNWFAKDEC